MSRVYIESGWGYGGDRNTNTQAQHTHTTLIKQPIVS